jgi:peroxiredoxin
MAGQLRRAAVAGLLTLAALSCGRNGTDLAKPPAGYPSYAYGPGYGPATFKDDAESNARVAGGSLDLAFVDAGGKAVALKSYRGKKHVVLVITRGFPGYVCPNCSAQTSRLISNYPEFVKRDTEVLVVFPGPKDHLQDFLQASRVQVGNAKVPFPILLDEDFRAVDQLGIRGDLAKPATYIVDKEGQVRFAYVGSTTADRPSLKALLRHLDEIRKS